MVLKKLFALVQTILPQHLLSRAIGWLADSESALIRRPFIAAFIKLFKVDMSEAVDEDPAVYSSFNAFFTRPLKPECRPLTTDVETLACPADGTICAAGEINEGTLLQAKGKTFDVTQLLGGDEFISQPFLGGKFFTVYLSPKDYHRVHMPFDGQLQSMTHIPGRLFSVNQATTETVNNLFARNERVVSMFDTNAGPMAVVLVGAMIVGSIETTWHGVVTPPQRRIHTIEYPNTTEAVNLSKGDEMGRFKLGSTVIVLFGPDMVEWDEEVTTPQSKVQMGQRIGELVNM